MKDLDIPSFYRHEIPVKNKNKKPNKADENTGECFNTKPSTSKQKIKKNNKNSKSEEIGDEYIKNLREAICKNRVIREPVKKFFVSDLDAISCIGY